MYSIALKMLTGDKGKYFLLVSALSFASLLMTQQGAIFLGLMRWSTSTIRNTNAAIWVMDPVVEQVNEVQPLRDIDLFRVRSVDDVQWAHPLYFSIQQAKFSSGKFKSILLMGVDSSTLIGMPSRIHEGNLSHLKETNGVIIDQLAVEKFSKAQGKPISLGDTFEINDREAKIVGICETEKSFFGYPYVYTTEHKFLDFVPYRRKNLSFILVKPKENISAKLVAQAIEKETGLKALTESDFSQETERWIKENTGIPLSFYMTVCLGFLVGMAVSCQTFYAFILENLPYLGVLKAMGVTNQELCKLLLIQALFVGFLGYGIGIGYASIFGNFAFSSKKIPFFWSASLLLFSLFVVLFICASAALLGIYKIRKLESAEVFRA
ncbi:MAG: ABC transporter permease [Waddliaceae bacterium]